MKKNILLILIFSMFLLLGCSKKSYNIEIGESDKFRRYEIQSAIDFYIKDKESNEYFNIERIYYDEEKSNEQVQYYTMDDSRPKQENMMILFINYNINEDAPPEKALPEISHEDWMAIMVRENKESNWTIYDEGY